MATPVGYEKYNTIRADPALCFLERVGKPDEKAVAAEQRANDYMDGYVHLRVTDSPCISVNVSVFFVADRCLRECSNSERIGGYNNLKGLGKRSDPPHTHSFDEFFIFPFLMVVARDIGESRKLRISQPKSK